MPNQQPPLARPDRSRAVTTMMSMRDLSGLGWHQINTRRYLDLKGLTP